MILIVFSLDLTLICFVVSCSINGINSFFFQGIEIINPSAAEKKVSEANAKYFSNTGVFHNIQKQDE